MSTALSQCQQFFAAIFEPSDVVEFRPIKPTSKRWATPADLAQIVPWLLPFNAQGAQCYFGANPRKQAGESKEDGVALARCLYADFDGGTTVEEAWSRIKAAGLPMPTVTVSTGGGVHCWWRLDQPITDRKLHGRLLKALAAALPSDEAGTSGWPRIMRLPGFVNTKYEHRPVAELVDVDANRVYSLAELTPATKGMSDATRAFVERGSLAATAGRRETMFAAACDLRDRGWTPDAAEAVLMPRMQELGLSADDLADCPRQIHNAWDRPPRAVTPTPAKKATSTNTPVEGYKPYPVDALPEPLSSFVAEAAAAIGCDPAYVALPLLTVAGAAIGTPRRLELKAGYTVPAILWTAIVGESGTSKSPALRCVLDHVRGHERQLREEARAAHRDYEEAVEVYKKELAAWRATKDSGTDQPQRPLEPRNRRALVTETTVEALAVKLADNPRGLLLARDELAGWLNGLDRYAGKSGGGGSDESFYLSAYNGEPHAVDRRTGDRREIYVPSAALWITGGIQPAILRRALGQERRESGLLARLLLTAPPARPAKWSEEEVSPITRQILHDVLGRLYALQPEVDAEGRDEPRLLRLDPTAKKAYVEWHDRHGEELSELTGDRAAGWSKLRETTARIALIFHEVRAAAGDRVAADYVDADSMDRALGLVEWHKRETRRVYTILGQTDEETAARQTDDRLAAWIDRHGGTATARDVIGGCHRWIANSDEAETALKRLIDAGRGRWIDKPAGEKGGRPTRLFVLNQSAAVEETKNLPPLSAQPRGEAAKAGCGSADAFHADEAEEVVEI